LRASNRVSPGFALHRHSSRSFGSQRTCSACSILVDRTAVMRSCRSSYLTDPNDLLRFRFVFEFATQTLACTLNSLVRVTRRDVWVRSRRHPEHLSGSRVGNEVQPSTQVSCLEGETPKGPWLPCRGKCLLPRSRRGYELVHRTPRTVIRTCGAL
jgi:hypothetical protein